MIKKFLLILTSLVIIISMFCGCSTQIEKNDEKDSVEYADTVVYGTIYTAENQEVVEAFAVKDGKYIYVGNKEGAEKYVKEGLTEVIDKTGDYLITPGFTEGHGHFFGIDAVMKVLPGFYADYDELLSIVDKKVKEEKIGKFFSYGINVIEMILTNEEDRNYAEEIEKVAPGIPVVFVDNAAHQAICNVTALKMAGLWDKQDLRGGEYMYDTNGRINGIIKDQALPYVIDKVIGTMLTPDEYRKACQIAIDNLHDRGFTNFFDAWLNFADDSSLYKYIKEFDDAGKLNLNVGACYNIKSYQSDKYKEVVDHVLDIANTYHSKHFNPYYIKLFADGVVEQFTGWLLEEYPGAEGEHKHGNIIWTNEELKDVTKYANSKGILIHTHAYGDGACHAITEAYLKSNEELGKKYRNGLGHVRNILDEDKKKIGENGISLSENLIWHCGDPLLKGADDLWPKGIIQNGYPMKSLLDNGIKISSSTDSPCGETITGNVMNIIEVATTGRFYDALDIPVFNPLELLTVKEALDTLTINGAWQMGLEEERGSIKVGKYADFSIMNKNILNYEGDKLMTIHEGKVSDMYFEGKNIYNNTNEKIKVDKIVKNAKVYTSNKKNLNVTSFAVKDGKFVYVGDEEGLKDYECDVVDMGKKFITPALIDSHIHISASVSSEYDTEAILVEGKNKNECLDIIRKAVEDNPNIEKYKFSMSKNCLNGERLTKEDLDKICSNKEILIVEGECHSVWVNSFLMEKEGITDDTPDIAPGLSYYERDEEGHKTGYLIEMTEAKIMMANADDITDEQIEQSISRFVDYAKKEGIVAVFEAGTPKMGEYHERVYKVLREMDKKGKLPIFIDGSYAVVDPKEIDDAISIVKRYREEFNTPHMKVNTLKIISDGTLTVHTASLVEPYADTGTVGGRLFEKEQIADILKKLNKEGIDLHVHTVGEGASKTILDGVEMVKKELGDEFKIQVACAHLENQCTEDLGRFAELGVIANYTPWWHGGGGSGGSGNVKDMTALLGSDRAHNMYRSKTVWDSGALVTWSSDNVTFGDFGGWSPYLGMEGGIRRFYDEHTKISEVEKLHEMVPTEAECMSIDEMLTGYTINNAKQLKIEDRKGSIEVGKDADYLVFDENLLEISPVGISNIEPKEVWFGGELISSK